VCVCVCVCVSVCLNVCVCVNVYCTVSFCALCVCVCVCVCKCVLYYYQRRPGSSVGIAPDYGLDGPGSYPGSDEIFRPPDRPWGSPSLL